jgi:site-specific recombinase XerD
LDTRGLLRPQDFTPRSPAKIQLAAYTDHLKHVRGCSSATVANHVRTASSFLDHVGYDAEPGQLEKLTQADIESFIIICSKKLVRSSMQQAVAHLRSFMRFLALKGETAAGREIQIDTSRLYRQEQLPRSLPWDTVRALLQSIDCTAPVGLRDYAMLFLIASYGLRASEIAHLTLDDFHWREGQLRVPQRKAGTPVVLPLTDSVVSVLMNYLREGRPTGVPRREVFLRIRAPIGPLTPTAVSMVFRRWARRSGLKIPSCGAHCLRHSYAVHLLRGGISLKTIGDLLGHRNAESTCAYLRLATEDLRAVALPLPDASKEDPQQEVQS